MIGGNWVGVALAATLVAGCGGDPDSDGDGQISMAEAAEEAKSAGTVKPQPGQYRATVQVVELEAPDAPPEAVAMMRDMMARSFEYCLTPEQADKGFEEMAKESQEGNCSFEKFDIDGGSIDAVMICAGQGGEEMRMTMQGSGDRTSSEMLMSMEGGMPGQGGGKLTMKTSHERIGDCAT